MILFHHYYCFIYSGGPVFKKVPLPFAPFRKDESIKIEVVVEASPKPTINWILNGKELTNKDSVQITKDASSDTYTLSIPKLLANHAGILNIKASNTVGTEQIEYNLDILG